MRKNLTLFQLFFYTSSLTFSGGLAMIPLLHQSLVIKNKWLTTETFYHYITLSQTLPGVTVVITACLLGDKVNGKVGRFWAVIGAILPVLCIMTTLTIIYNQMPQTGIILYLFTAIRATACVFIFEAALSIYHLLKKDQITYVYLCVLLMALLFLRIDSLWIILGCFILAVIETTMKRRLS